MGMDYEEILRVKLFSCEEYTFRKTIKVGLYTG